MTDTRDPAPDLLEALKDMVRIVEAMRMTTGLGKGQAKRLDDAKALIARSTTPHPARAAGGSVGES